MTTKPMKTFLASDDGNVMVDWIVLAGALIGLGLAFMAVMSTGVEDRSGALAGELESMPADTDPFRANGAAIAANDPVPN